MTMNYLDQVEQEQQLLRETNEKDLSAVFLTKGSAGKNPERLTKLLTTWDFVVNLLGWQDKPLANLSMIVTQYQASNDTRSYHDDYVEIEKADEALNKQSRRRFSLRNGSNGSLVQ